MRGCQREMGDTGNGEEEENTGKEERLAPLLLSHWAWSQQAPAGPVAVTPESGAEIEESLRGR